MSLSKIHGGYTTAVSALSSSSSSSAACASCKYQRKKCTSKCVFAPCFPKERQEDFLNAHKIFGVSNITKMIKRVEESQRDIAMETLIFHANTRVLDPVGGVYRIISDLRHNIECCEAELKSVYQQLAMYRFLAQQQQTQRQDLSLAYYPYGNLLEQEEFYDYHQPNLLNYETFLEMPEQTNQLEFKKEYINLS